jgi:hypothetical protein
MEVWNALHVSVYINMKVWFEEHRTLQKNTAQYVLLQLWLRVATYDCVKGRKSFQQLLYVLHRKCVGRKQNGKNVFARCFICETNKYISTQLCLEHLHQR